VADGLVTTDGRRCYSVTKDGVERLLEGAAELKRYARMVMEEVIEHVSVWTALAEVDLAEGERVSLIFSLPRIIAVIRSKSLLKPLFLMSVMIKSVIAMHNLID
jgi:predicted transcriptional regulator